MSTDELAYELDVLRWTLLGPTPAASTTVELALDAVWVASRLVDEYEVTAEDRIHLANRLKARREAAVVTSAHLRCDVPRDLGEHLDRPLQVVDLSEGSIELLLQRLHARFVGHQVASCSSLGETSKGTSVAGAPAPATPATGGHAMSADGQVERLGSGLKMVEPGLDLDVLCEQLNHLQIELDHTGAELADRTDVVYEHVEHGVEDALERFFYAHLISLRSQFVHHAPRLGIHLGKFLRSRQGVKSGVVVGLGDQRLQAIGGLAAALRDVLGHAGGSWSSLGETSKGTSVAGAPAPAAPAPAHEPTTEVSA